MKKIDCIYVVCNKPDLYFAKVCVASIRYWNNYTPVRLIKDLSKGNFDTASLEEKFNVQVERTAISSLGYFAKLQPLVEQKNERIMILDCDIIWMCDVVKLLEQFNEDIIIDGYSPEDMETEKTRWYFFEPSFSGSFPDYVYPGFFFNVGQMLMNTDVFKKQELLDLIHWRENPSAKVPATFFYEHGILNYLLAKKISERSITFKNINFHLWGWDNRVPKFTPKDIADRKEIPYLIHWYGNKNGLLSFLPGSQLLKTYESYYYSKFPNGNVKMTMARWSRTFSHPVNTGYELLKSVYLKFFRRK